MMRLSPYQAFLVFAVYVLCLTTSAFGACTGSSPVWASTPDLSSVQTCINSATNGDTINVQAGTAAWSGRADVENKGLTIIGAGAGNTVITGAFELRNTKSPWPGSRVSGFTFHMNNSYFIVEGEIGFRIDHNNMDEPSWTMGIDAIGSLVGGVSDSPSEGLIDNNTFSNVRIVVDGEYTDTGGNQRWFEPLNEGTSHAVYIEDNIASQSSSSINNFVDANLGGRYVVRFNTMQNTYLEFHSIQGDGIRGARLAEIYGNTFNMNLTGYIRTAFLRAGTGMVFDNTFNGDWHNPNFDMDNVRTCHANHDGDFPVDGFCLGSGTVDGNSDPSGFVCRDQPGASTDASLWNGKPPAPAQQKAPWYFLHNLNNGNEIPWGLTTANCENNAQSTALSTQIQNNRDAYQLDPSFDGTSGIGRGTLASRPSTCTTGVGYWTTDQGEWNSRNSGPDGELFTCTSTNTWTMTYIPYTYPHPLQSGANPPAPPSGLQATVQ
jgi:hypothetical protein